MGLLKRLRLDEALCVCVWSQSGLLLQGEVLHFLVTIQSNFYLKNMIPNDLVL